MTALLAALLTGLGTAGTARAATVDTSASYVLVNRGSGKVLDVTGASTADGAGLTQWTRTDSANQQFRFVDSGGGYYRLRAQHSGKVLDVLNYSTADHADIAQWSDAGGTNQQFRLADSPDGYVRLINRNSGKAVEVENASTADGAKVVQYTDWGGANQQWQLVRVGAGSGGALPSTFRWSSSGVLAGPKPDAQHPDAAAIKDFSIVRYNNQWLTFATTASPSGWGLVQFNFDDWSQAASAPQTYLDTSPMGSGYRAAPQVFYFAPQNLWYMVYQTGPPTYSTSTNPADPHSWSAPRTLISQEPPIVTQNKGNGTWIDFWVICDTANCHLLFSDDNGHIYRAQTSLANFPNGFGNTQMVMSDTKNNLFEATNVYKVADSDQYLLLQEAISNTSGRRYFRSFTSSSLTGSWTPLAATENEPFASRNNVTFPGGAWTQDISHGEMARAGNDQTLTINPCRLQYVYQGMDPNAGGDYIRLPWRMGLLTQTNSTC
ncbi:MULTISPECIES: non-reducing end alpha-L-arabinofuranosidase family hydrolase [Streptomyces]|uniref:non-reducing end alpha-L-arabinofuranosidase family hydrolase n=1 Tax=Streptomyces sp. RLB3-6 TaxID=2594457 RepID=UPI001F079625|nr:MULTISPECIES: non-reducing end alpha-L-arabinofuranosidase family hydrolase [Streptomyces]MCX4615173.1 non-reducing end alpha-L-arabinofuranosidase family hydrolase [Streptomyces mirabilis]